MCSSDLAVERDGRRPPPEEIELIDVTADDVAKRDDLAGLAGHRLFIAHSQGLIRLDTDSGTITRLDGSELSGSLIGRFRDQLILLDGQNRVTAVPVDDPMRESTLLFELQAVAVTAARMIDDHRLALSLWGPEFQRSAAHERLLIDLESGDTVTLDSGWRADDLTWVPGGGLFEYVDGRYRHLADGIPLVAAEHRVLVRGCTGPEDCDNQWIDRQTGDNLDGYAPPEEWWEMQAIDPDGRVLFVNDAEGHRYFDTEHGWLLPTNVVRGTGGSYFDTPAEDLIAGRYLVAPTILGIVIYDLSTDDGFLLDVGEPEPRGITNIVAVPKPNRWSRSP